MEAVTKPDTVTFIHWDNPYEVGIYDIICGLPIDEGLKDNLEYLRGRQVGEKQLEELEKDK